MPNRSCWSGVAAPAAARRGQKSSNQVANASWLGVSDGTSVKLRAAGALTCKATLFVVTLPFWSYTVTVSFNVVPAAVLGGTT